MFGYFVLLQSASKNKCLNRAQRKNLISDFGKCGEKTETPKQIAINYEVGEWPWMGSLGNWSTGGQWLHYCGTTLISQTYFITAAHCCQTAKLNRWCQNKSKFKSNNSIYNLKQL